MNASIEEITEFSTETLYSVQGLLTELMELPPVITENHLQEIAASENSHLFVIREGEDIAGMLSIGIYLTPTGRKAWIEDVVTLAAHRGKGYGKALVQHAVDFARKANVDTLMLTSRSSRVAANKLYQDVGFKRKETNVYVSCKRHDIKP